MNYKQLLINSMVVIGLSCFTSLAFAKELKIINNTSEASTCKTAKGCSTDLLGVVGITPAHDSRTYSAAKIRIACKDHLDNCVADVYMTNNCTGPVIASAAFGLDAGLISITPKAGNNYQVSGTPGDTNVTIGYK